MTRTLTMAQQPETAIIIRTRNEERWIGEVLKRLQEQTYRNFEIVVVDSGSTDQTLSIVAKYQVQVVTIKPQEFTYPYAINVGIKNSGATKYFVILSAHSLPINKNWLASGLEKFSLYPDVCGVYGPLKALPDGTFWDKLFHNTTYFLTWLKMIPKSHQAVTATKAGVLGFTNAIIRRDLWEQYPINERFAGGGEDGDWVKYWFAKGYRAVKDMHFTVRHSHYLDFIGWRAQIAHWKEIAKPKPFKHLTYRKDGSHNPL